MAAQHRVIEVGIVLLEDGEIVEEWSTLVHPGIRIPSSIAAFTGIDDSMVADAPPFRRRRAGSAAAARGPAVRRAQRALRLRLPAHGVPPAGRAVRGAGAVHRASCRARSMPEHARHNLDTLMERFGLSCMRAASRARRCAGAARAARGDGAASVARRSMHDAVTAALREPRLPPHLPPELADDLPEGPGVYLFRGEGGRAAVRRQEPQHPQPRVRSLRGRASLRQGIEAHAAGAPGGMDRDRRRTRRAAARVAAGEGTGADGQSPPAQERRRLRRAAAPDGDGLRPRGRAAGRRRLASTPIPVFGPFRAEKDAWRAIEGKAREAGLCLKTLGRETGEGSCFAYQVQQVPRRLRRQGTARAARCPAAAGARVAAAQAVAVRRRHRHPRAGARRARHAAST